MEKIGLFGGSFDPLHFGHLNLAVELREKWELDAVWFCPVKISPFKQRSAPNVSGRHRFEMLQRAIEGISGFSVLDLELEREGPSYTVDTLIKLKQQYKDKEFYLLLGRDSVTHFFKWHKPDEIISLAKLVIGSRLLGDFKEISGSPSIQEAIKQGLTKTRVIDMSSTEIRERLIKKMYCGHLLPAKVLDYIIEHSLYSDNDYEK